MKNFTFSNVPANLDAKALAQYQRKEFELYVRFAQETITRLENEVIVLTARVQALEQ